VSLPGHRERSALHIVTEAGETVVHDATDVGNAAMAAAFERCRYELTGRFMVFT
jgi:RimJ/RimL family protein N-acetyltransferase